MSILESYLVRIVAEIAFPQCDIQNYHRANADEEQDAGTP